MSFVAGSVYEHEKKYDEAEERFKRVLSGDPHNAMVLNYLGYMLADRGLRLEEALGYVKKAIEQDPQNGAYLDSLGWAYFKLGNYELAEENLVKASQKMSNDGTIQDHLAELFYKTGRVKLAAAHWERALEEWNKSSPYDVDSSDVDDVGIRDTGDRAVPVVEHRGLVHRIAVIIVAPPVVNRRASNWPSSRQQQRASSRNYWAARSARMSRK